MDQPGTNSERRGDASPPAATGQLGGLPFPLRWAVIGAAAFGVVGGVVGLVVGVLAYPPTAWFAVLEIGFPAAVLGAWIGLLAGGVASLVSDRDRNRSGAGQP
jgi:hypothetical protein